MKKWIKFFFLGFFSHDRAKEAVRRGYTNAFLGFVIALVFLWCGFFLGDMLPFGVQYDNSSDFKETLYSVLANADADKRVDAELKDGELKLGFGGEYTEGLLINTFESESDRAAYSQKGYNVVVDSRPADTLAEIYAYCISNDGKETEISYDEYLTLSQVARLNFDFKLRYTGNELLLTDERVAGYLAYLNGLDDESRAEAQRLSGELSSGGLERDEYNREIYGLYFSKYYPEIKEYERSSAVPLLRNYYYHNYLSDGNSNYLFIFDDYITGSFTTKGGMTRSFYGFYGEMDDGALVSDGASQTDARAAVDRFVKSAFAENRRVNGYVYLINVITLVPFIALMLMVAALLPYSILRLCGVESIFSLGAMIRIVGSFTWFAGVISAVLSVIGMFFINQNLINALPPVLFFIALAIRSVIFAINESRLYKQKAEQAASEEA